MGAGQSAQFPLVRRAAAPSCRHPAGPVGRRWSTLKSNVHAILGTALPHCAHCAQAVSAGAATHVVAAPDTVGCVMERAGPSISYFELAHQANRGARDAGPADKQRLLGSVLHGRVTELQRSVAQDYQLLARNCPTHTSMQRPPRQAGPIRMEQSRDWQSLDSHWRQPQENLGLSDLASPRQFAWVSTRTIVFEAALRLWTQALVQLPRVLR